MNVDQYTHMEEAWLLDENPFPADAIRKLGSNAQPYSAEVFQAEAQDFRRKFVRGALASSARVGFLWSAGVRHDTGYGKTTLMQAMRDEVNDNLGANTLEAAGLKPERILPIAVALTNLNGLQVNGLYPVLHQAAVDLSVPNLPGRTPILDLARIRIVNDIGNDDAQQIANAVQASWISMSPGGTPLRSDLLSAFATGGAAQTIMVLNGVSDAMRLRAGIIFLDFALAVLGAAGIDKLILMIDQLEDLATNKSIPSSKRSREIGRIRDLLEQAPYADRLKLVFTFHNRAAQTLERFWESNRLPSFENVPANASSVVALTGLSDDDKAGTLLKTYLEVARTGKVEDDLLPFEPDAVSELRRWAEDRPGPFLSNAFKVFDYAANANLPKITGEVVRRVSGGEVDSAVTANDDVEVGDQNVDDLLLG
ncbi:MULTISPECIES: hypothetical protein [unclassified Mesorhizobium]|uniref:hypothetical protein n=1 Tax=unclassified Mesorhizobium TaxID=325217 RepID=UPI003335D88B